MRPVRFIAKFGDIQKHVELSEPSGMSGAGWQILIDRFYHGMIVKYKGAWVGHLTGRVELTADDIQAMGERIEEAYPETK